MEDVDWFGRIALVFFLLTIIWIVTRFFLVWFLDAFISFIKWRNETNPDLRRLTGFINYRNQILLLFRLGCWFALFVIVYEIFNGYIP